MLLGEIPHDFDFATNCPLSVTKTLFTRVFSTGESHGTLSVLYDDHLFEVTRFRKDISTDGRRALVSYSDSIEEDQKRRDIRINSLAYDVVEERVVDSQEGLKDFESKMIRFVGKAKERILEDHLRAIRYIRIIARLKSFGFGYDPEEMEQVVAVFDSSKLSLERIYEEITKINQIRYRDKDFCSRHLARLNIFSPYFDKEEQAATVVKSVIEKESFFPFCFEYNQTHSVKETVIALKLSKKHKKILNLLNRFKNCDFSKTIQVKELLSQIATQDIKETAKAFLDTYNVDLLEQFYGILSRKEPIHPTDLAISGNAIKKMGYKGEKAGKILRFLQEKVWKDPHLNQPEILRQLASKMAKMGSGL